MWRRSSFHPKKPNLAWNRDGARLYFLLSSTYLWCCNFQISALERTLSGCLLSISIDFTPFPVKLISARTGIRMYTCRCISPNGVLVWKPFRCHPEGRVRLSLETCGASCTRASCQRHFISINRPRWKMKINCSRKTNLWFELDFVQKNKQTQNLTKWYWTPEIYLRLQRSDVSFHRPLARHLRAYEPLALSYP